MDSLHISLPEQIQEHLKTLIPESPAADREKFLEELKKNWNSKHELFNAQIKSLDMIYADNFESEDPSAALMLTYSGSLIGFSTVKKSHRRIEYYSIKLRADVPEAMKIEETQIKGQAAVGKVLELNSGALQKTSALFKIARFKEGVSEDEQNIRVEEAIIFLTDGFVKINQELNLNSSPEPGQFTIKSIITQIAHKNDLSRKQIKTILDDYWNIIEKGILMGEKIPLGKIGKAYLKMRHSRKARIGKNLITGDDVTIRAKPEMAVPKMSFSSYIKNKAQGISIDHDLD
ncbi:MAG TPA: HU family DNA-binding protein [Spirochaetota bacterium]|nr:HU family DNA-binding protein [Spirochaetota bacterium]HPI89062.1 HU family DNA-binding protein [Spirochaetota bacterium]HPR48727.1 HU family DNA-binding protein [Spirochaetota bacterium]